MYRLAVCALLAAAAATALAAPAPTQRKDRPWFAGWGEPVDPLGDCVFERSGDRLTVTVPAGGRHLLAFHFGRHTFTAPRLLREVEGDFAVEVRVGGNFGGRHGGGGRRAGILLLAGEAGAKVSVGAFDSYRKPHLLLEGRYFAPGTHSSSGSPGPKAGEAATLRLERRGRGLLMKASTGGGPWEEVFEQRRCESLPEKVQVGVVAEMTDEGGPFRADFSRFRLTPLDPNEGR